MLTELPIKETVISLVIATGGVTSDMVTIALQLPELPDASVAVKVTVLLPILEQSNVVGVTVLVTIAQLSVLLLSISAAVIEAEFPFNVLETFWQMAVGGI